MITDFHQPKADVLQWYDIRGLHDTDLIQEIGKTFGVHPLALEDIADIYQRPKYEEYGNGNFLTTRAIRFNKEKIK